MNKDDKKYYATFGCGQGSWWSLWPPILPSGDSISAASLIDASMYGDIELIFPVARNGEVSDITHIMWSAFALTEKGRVAFESFSIRGLWFSPAKSSNGIPLWVARSPVLRGVIEEAKSRFVREGHFPKNHPLAHRSGKIQSMSTIALQQNAVSDYDLFYLAEYPVLQIISGRLIQQIETAHLSGLGVDSYADIRI